MSEERAAEECDLYIHQMGVIRVPITHLGGDDSMDKKRSKLKQAGLREQVRYINGETQRTAACIANLEMAFARLTIVTAHIKHCWRCAERVSKCR